METLYISSWKSTHSEDSTLFEKINKKRADIFSKERCMEVMKMSPKRTVCGQWLCV